MPDEHDRWLDRETAERLLRGERLGAGDSGAARDLARVLDALSAAPADPADRAAHSAAGEDAALAAFREARAARGAAGTGTPDTPGAAFPVRGHARRGRGAARHRFVLAAVLVAGVVGGGAAIGGGLHGFVSGDRAPAGSVATGMPVPSGTTTPVPLGSEAPAAPLSGGALSGVTDGVGVRPPAGSGASAGGTGGDGSATSGAHDGATSGPDGRGDARDAAGSGEAHGDRNGPGAGGGSSGGRSGDRGRGSRESLRDTCRDHLAGRSLTAEQRRELAAAAGSAGVSAYCAGLVGDGGEAPADGSLKGDDDGDDQGHRDHRKKDRRGERGESAENGRRTVAGQAAGERGPGAGRGGAGRARETSAHDRTFRPEAGSPAERGTRRERGAEPATAGRRG
ncbi:hypothetical protein [Streptomyces fragilis]|uniref:Uncharacterized protein n=1 Tax=Streptomyces fragilis TaxID=67301 RepID=A0ABV2YII8_9ACTN|nr:hypothetical protein [Streptomyces fragilis]